MTVNYNIVDDDLTLWSKVMDPDAFYNRFSHLDLGRKSIDEKIKQKRKQLATEIKDLCVEFSLDAGYHHISDLLNDLEKDYV